MNARIYIKIFMAILFIGIMPSCTYDTIHVGGLNEHANVTLTLALDDQVLNVSRVADDGTETSVDPETVINTVDLFFYKDTKNTTSEEEPIFETLPITSVKVNSASITDVEGGKKLSFSMPVEDFEALFPSATDAQCQVYAIANLPANTLPEDVDYSIASLKENVILHAPEFANGNIESFVMDGVGVARLTVSTTETSLSGEITVQRVASKISFAIKKIENVTADGVTWAPNLGTMKVSLRRALNKIDLRAVTNDPALAYSTLATSDFIFKRDNVTVTPLDNGTATTDTDSTPSTEEVTEMTERLNFYTYPANWKNNKNVDTHLILTVEWNDVAEKEAPITTYYQVNVNPGYTYTERNRHYHITQEISVLGSLDEETPQLLKNASYQVLGWKEGTEASGNLVRYKYLVVEETDITLQNVTKKYIYFATSDPIDLYDAEIKWNYTATNKAEDLTMAEFTNKSRVVDTKTGDITYTFSNSTAPITNVANRIIDKNTVPSSDSAYNPDIDYRVYITIHHATSETDRSYIKVTHNLDNSMTRDADYTAYKFELSVAHGGDSNSSYKGTINIVQYPMLSIMAELNSEYKTGDEALETKKGYVYINGNNTGSGWAAVGPLDNDYNCNPNRYHISIASLANTEVGQQYIIGDPRSTTSSVPNEIYRNGNNELNTYYPTRADNETKQMISPEFMIASSYSRCPNYMDKTEVVKRCATYQEDGYPAGRWRVPTEAEVRYIIQLSGWGKIPALFNTGINYWSANGTIQVSNNGTVSINANGNSAVVRCVYDTWYWGKEAPLTGTQKQQFTYGDER